uniref:Ubiquitin-like domain-containing protein n=1 Tax=Gorilla gorilla gorilla TaxID=9595 RepID=G3S6C1_GORGO
MQLFAYMRARELHTLEVTGLETVAQSKAHVASLEGLIPEDKVVLLAGSPLQNEATLGQCGVEALTTLEVVGRKLGGEWGYRGPKLVSRGNSRHLDLLGLPCTVCYFFFSFCFSSQYLKVS